MAESFKCAYTELVELHKLIPNPKNANHHPQNQIELLAKIIDYQGQRSPIVVSKRSGFVTKGHGRLLAMYRLGWQRAAVDYQDYESEAQEFADMIADNKISELAEHDDKKMFDEIPKIQDLKLEMLGIPDLKMPKLFEPQSDEDEIPTNFETKTKLGYMYKLGSHSLLCGDSTSAADVDRLIDGNAIDLVFTDPPYGMNAVSKSGVLSARYKTDIIGDSDTNAAKDSFNLIFEKYKEAKHIWFGANYYSSCLPDSECWIVWDKNNGKSDQTDCELAWTNMRSVVRQVTMASEKKNRIHPTQKPVKLFEDIVERMKLDGTNVLDVFGGSGSTLIACEKNNRKCFLMEMDPYYCDLIVARWEKYTGKKAELIGKND